jgi:hypothetical protein
MIKKECGIGVLLFFFFLMFFVYQIGYYIGKDDSLIVIENEVTDIRKTRKELGDSWQAYYSETALLKIHNKLTGKEP